MWALLILLLMFILVEVWAHRSSSASTAAETPPIATEEPANRSGAGEAPEARASPGRYLASCPVCGERLTRRDFFTFQRQIRKKCRKCQTPLRSNYRWDMVWSLIFVSPFGICLFLALIGTVGWIVPVAALLLFFIAGYVLFPFHTKLEVADESETHQTVPLTTACTGRGDDDHITFRKPAAPRQ
jgi:hypothetical protein